MTGKTVEKFDLSLPRCILTRTPVSKQNFDRKTRWQAWETPLKK